ncbi:MAG TPA: biotin--[acetyl-CoA-carboxylase] ligase [Chitinophagales bacterium]|mgnify:CR=1 FL=1|nr:biotin--[acetyl-CoA-carboxylase] ligase [Chitinophagales bacterium]HRP38244.1 biotin--[acetyl-CoA-carboxylase] ligase [Chitinophagales bacterium]
MDSSPLFIGINVIELEETTSTNTEAKLLIEKEKPLEGTVIIANKQTKGKGQQGNSWQTEAGKNLTCSYILYPVFLSADKHFYLNMVVSLAVKEACEVVLEDEVKVKWPNDVYYGNKKIAGILIENSISGATVITSVVGIGLNVNQTEFDTELQNAGSLKQFTGHDVLLQKIQQDLNIYLEKYYLQLRQQHFHFLQRAYTEALFRYNQTAYFKKGEQTFKGEITGIARDGKLIIESGGKEMRFNMQEVKFVI